MERSAGDIATMLNDIERELEELKTTQLRVREELFPVGSIYMSATMSTVSQVQSTFGGSWVSWGSGRVPVGVNTSDSSFNTVEKTGGEKTHTLTVSEMPAHTHPMVVAPRYSWEYGSGGAMYGQNSSTSAANNQATDSTGGGGAHNNLQPYITCYMYKRVS